VVAVSVYAVGMLAMLGFSTAYNFAKPHWRPLLRRLDHAGIFLMIAGSYTPFTTHNLTGAWAWAMTGAVWGLATLGALGKLFLPGVGKRFWVVLYVALSWLVVIAFKPMVAHGSWIALLLLAIGGALYMSGASSMCARSWAGSGPSGTAMSSPPPACTGPPSWSGWCWPPPASPVSARGLGDPASRQPTPAGL
jgi:channel protein (hemolysin III family)